MKSPTTSHPDGTIRSYVDVKSGHWYFSGEVQRGREDMIKLYAAFHFWEECHAVGLCK